MHVGFLKWSFLAAMAVLAATIVGNTALAETDADKALLGAIRGGNLKAAEQAIAQGANVNDQGALPLYVAAQEGRFEMVKFLVEKGANINGVMAYGQVATPFRVAIRNVNRSGSYDMVNYLLGLGADPAAGGIRKLSPLTAAVRTRRLDQVKKVVRSGNANFEHKEWFSKPGDGGGKTALMIGAELGLAPIAEYLVAQGAKVNNSEWCGETALYYAALRGRVEVVKLLLRLGAQADPKKFPPACGPVAHPMLATGAVLRLGKDNEALEIYRLLLEAGGDPEAGRFSEAKSPVDTAFWYCNDELFALLVKHGASLRYQRRENFQKKCGMDPLAGTAAPTRKGGK